ncbi:MAG TPA: UDP-N-acetylmuramoyl-L-alanyl-D-glutamate--2,6-diaminopimelate ligase [Solirubrobacteraceae bacterium]|jgi:UDP-N-acetylmuramoyl-L-alanyl-D-glutamate--2,6-diaminopimelate ligase|nr:UDP-N-acetylmuramoyl-L-alanyl-D-glutamate--2,6-diaminopimelate ligase [Solirubrobacteraceae bacterium]
MRLHEVIPGAAPEARDVEIADLAYDNRRVTPETLFFCVPGMTRDGHDFAQDAVQRGAVALVVQRPLDLAVPEILVPDVRAAMAPAAARFNGDPSATLDVVGVTGTNGKTTTAFLARELLVADGRQTGLLGTVKSVIGGVEHEVVRTTPEAIDLQRDLKRMLDGGDLACAIEVSSHALELRRADAIRFAAAIFTNLTQDHLDFHLTMEDYFAAKRRLFEPGRARTAIVNIDDRYGARLARELDQPVTFALDDDSAAYVARNVETSQTGSRFQAVTPAGATEITTPLRGRFNVYNILGALAAAHALGVSPGTAAKALETAHLVPGRFEPVDAGQPFAVLVDYAHTPDSLENVLNAARALVDRNEPGRLHVVFGAGGDRDRGKRPLMGEIARRLADRVIVTSDNPRSEEPEAIIAEILEGAGGGAKVEHLVDRREAIERALATAERGDVVVIAGKGHEQGQEFAGGRKLPFDDATVARELLSGVPARR